MPEALAAEWLLTFRPSECGILVAGPFSGLSACPVTAAPRGGAETAAVVLAEGDLLVFAEMCIRVDVRGVLDLLLGHGQHD